MSSSIIFSFFYFLFDLLHLMLNHHHAVIELNQILYDFLNLQHDDFCIY